MTLLYDPELQPLDIGLAARQNPRRRRFISRKRAIGWLRRRRVDLVLVLALMALGGLVHAVGMYASPARFDDEGTYTAYAWAVEYLHRLSHYTYWYAHPPLGWIQISAWTTLTDGFDRAPYAVAAAREFMLVCKLAAIPLLYGLGRRLGYARWAAAVGVVLFAFSPLSVYFTRAALLDNIVTPWLLASFFFAGSPRRSVRAAVASGLCCAVAVLSKETALLYLPAVLLLLWQHADRRNRRFTFGLFGAFFGLACALYPTYALVKNELLPGPGHVSLEWAVRWQLFDRTGSGSIFDPHSTAHAVIRSWWDQDPWLPALSLALVIPGLCLRRSRAVAVALALQLVQLLRSGYLPYPYVIAMIPFAALTVAGVLDSVWRLAVGGPAAATADPVYDDGEPHGRVLPAGGRPVIDLRSAPRGPLRGAGLLPGRETVPPPVALRGARSLPMPVQRAIQIVLVGGMVWLLVCVTGGWQAPLRDLRDNRRDAGKAQALTWLRSYTPKDATMVVDDAFWVDVVRSGHPTADVIWFTKLDVDSDVKLAGWSAIDYVVLDQQDDLSLHLQENGQPSQDTRDLFPTIAKALNHARLVAKFGVGRDAVTIRQVDPTLQPRLAGGPGRPVNRYQVWALTKWIAAQRNRARLR